MLRRCKAGKVMVMEITHDFTLTLHAQTGKNRCARVIARHRRGYATLGFIRCLDAIYNHTIKKLPVTAGNLGKLDPHSTGCNRVIRPMHIYPDYFGINRKTTI